MNRNIRNFVWYGVVEGVAGEGLRSVGVEPKSLIQERVLYPAPRPSFTGRSILRGPSPFVRSRGAKEGRPRPLYFAADPAPDILATWVGAPQPSLLESRGPLCE